MIKQSVKTETFSSSYRYIPTTEVCKYVRNLLKNKFPGKKFSVRKSSGSSVEVYVNTTGLSEEYVDRLLSEVRDTVGIFHGNGFDGMIDMSYSLKHYLTLDNEIVYGGTEGTEGSRGSVPAEHIERPNGAIEVHLSNSFIFVQREY